MAAPARDTGRCLHDGDRAVGPGSGSSTSRRAPSPWWSIRYSPCWIRPNEGRYADSLRRRLSAELPAAPRTQDHARSAAPMVSISCRRLEGVKISHCWTGKTAFTFDMMPHSRRATIGVEYAHGLVSGPACSMGTYLGHKTVCFACWATGEASPPRRPGSPSRASRSTPAAPGSCRSRWRGTSTSDRKLFKG